MRISSVISAYMPNALRTPEGGRKALAQGLQESTRQGDRVIISEGAMERFQKAQARVASGYYNQDSVADDISEKMTRILDELTG